MLLRILVGGRVEIGTHASRLAQNHPHTEGTRFHPQGIAHRLQRELAGIVRTDERDHKSSAHCADIDNAPRALGAHCRQYQLSHPQRAESVGLELAADLVHAEFLHRSRLRIPGVIDQRINAPGLCQHILHGGCHTGLVGHVQSQGGDVVARQIIDGLQPPRRSEDAPAFFGQQERCGAADAGGTTGDENDRGV